MGMYMGMAGNIFLFMISPWTIGPPYAFDVFCYYFSDFNVILICCLVQVPV